MAKGVYITVHAERRIRKRLGLSRSAVERNAEKAFVNGITHSEAVGQLKKYFNRVYLTGISKGNKATNIRVYNHYVYIFSGNTLITMLKLPRELEDIENLVKQKKNNESSATEETEQVDTK